MGWQCRKEILVSRHLILKAIRQWFYSRGFIEIQPPVISNTPLPESSVDLFEIGNTQFSSYLLPSPELYLKPLLASGLEKFFAIGPAFRKDERGQRHLPQFTILEWYRANSDYHSLMKDCHGLISAACREALGTDYPFIYYSGRKIDITPPFETLTVQEAFQEIAGWNPILKRDERRFEEDLSFRIEPALPANRPVFLKDFPAWAASLSKLQEKDTRVAERVELYMGGIELANGFSELLDPEEQKVRFENENLKRLSLGMKALPMPKEFLSALKGCPPSAGMAMGIDRLVMLFTNRAHITETTVSPA